MPDAAGFDGSDPITEQDDQLFRACLRDGPLSIDQLAERLHWERSVVVQRTSQLRRLGLLADQDGGFIALPPRVAMDGLAGNLESAAAAVRGRAADWGTLWQGFRQDTPVLEVLQTTAEERAADNGLLRSARHQIRGMQIGPIRSPVGPRPVKVPDSFFEATKRGVRFRMVYGVDILRDAEGLAAVQACISVGEEARVFPDVPLNLSVADDRLGMLSASGDEEHPRHAVVVHPSGLLTALISMFESYWRMGVPVPAEQTPTGRSNPDRHSRQLLAYLCAGLTDETIARELGVSERTVGRRIARLQQLLGAGSRFQLGIQATRRGWI